MTLELNKIAGFENTTTAAFLNVAVDLRKAGEAKFDVSAPAPSALTPTM